MSYSLVLLRGNVVARTLPISTFFQPSSTNVYDTAEPPLVVAVDKAWTFRGVLKGASAAIAAGLWTALRDLVAGTGAEQIDGARLLDANGDTVEDLSVDSSYASVKLESLATDQGRRPELQWHSEVNWTLRITGRFRLVNVSGLEQHEAWVYDEAGLLTRTLTGTIETKRGTSATAQAQTFGLSLPSSFYAFVTNGPGGVNVDRLDAGDTKASFTSSYGQSGSALPSGVGPDFSLRIEKTTSAGEATTITTVTATGQGAAAAVDAKAPTGSLSSSSVSKDPFRLRASAVYVQKGQSQPGRMLMLWSFSIAGGGAGADSTERAGGRVPALHQLPLSAVKITETVAVQVTGTPSDNDFKMPAALALDNVLEDGRARRVDPGHRVDIGATRSADRWVAGVTRVYVAAEIPAGLPTVIGQQVLRPDSAAAKATTPAKILSSARRGSSGGGNDLSGLGGLGIAGAAAGAGDSKINFGVL